MPIEVWPVIHVVNTPQSLECADIAVAARCAGVMLISMDGRDEILDPIAARIRSDYPGIKIGVNYLTMLSIDALHRSQNEGYAATWSDRQDFFGGKPERDATPIGLNLRKGHRFFTAIDFKGQRHDVLAGDSALLAATRGLIPTTSGPVTGIAQGVGKLSDIRRKLFEEYPLAIASGVTPENVSRFKPYVTHILVSTGISKSFHEFDGDKLVRLMAEVR